ncbi:MAG: LysE/ArgO family amino acid transporter [Granulosicoccus sp.]
MLPFLTGAGLGASLIIAIGAQNAFLLGQAIRGNYAFSVALTCSLVDAALIALGVWGLGTFIENSPRLLLIITLGGAVFLFIYGLMAFRRALNPEALQSSQRPLFSSLGSVLTTTLSLSLLNPHVYLDTVLLVGSVGARLPGDEPLFFTAGAISASFAWFFTLACSGRVLAPIFSKPTHWRRLDLLIGIVMWLIAISLLRTL